MELNDCDTEEKAVNRNLIRDFTVASLRRKPKDWIVGCLPGPKLLEVLQIWRNCGVLKRNIYGFSNNEDELSSFRKYGIKAVSHDLFDVSKTFGTILGLGNKCNFNSKKIRNKLRIFDVIYFDLYSNFIIDHIGLLLTFFKVALKDNGVCGYTFYGGRENDAALKMMLQNKHAYYKTIERSGYLASLLVLSLKRRSCEHKWMDRKFCTSLFRSKYVAKSIPMYTVLGKFRSFKHYKFGSKLKTDDKIDDLITNSKLIRIGTDNENTEHKRFIAKLIRNKFCKPKQRRHYAKDGIDDEKKDIIYLLKNNIPTKEIAECYNCSVQRIAAYKAHMTMGTYN